MGTLSVMQQSVIQGGRRQAERPVGWEGAVIDGIPYGSDREWFSPTSVGESSLLPLSADKDARIADIAARIEACRRSQSRYLEQCEWGRERRPGRGARERRRARRKAQLG